MGDAGNRCLRRIVDRPAARRAMAALAIVTGVAGGWTAREARADHERLPYEVISLAGSLERDANDAVWTARQRSYGGYDETRAIRELEYFQSSAVAFNRGANEYGATWLTVQSRFQQLERDYDRARAEFTYLTAYNTHSYLFDQIARGMSRLLDLYRMPPVYRDPYPAPRPVRPPVYRDPYPPRYPPPVYRDPYPPRRPPHYPPPRHRPPGYYPPPGHRPPPDYRPPRDGRPPRHRPPVRDVRDPYPRPRP